MNMNVLQIKCQKCRGLGALLAPPTSAHISDEYSKLPIHSNINDLMAYFNSI